MAGRKVQDVQRTSDGYGINIWDDNGRLAVEIGFETRDRAEEAHAQIKAIIDAAAFVKKFG